LISDRGRPTLERYSLVDMGSRHSSFAHRGHRLSRMDMAYSGSPKERRRDLEIEILSWYTVFGTHEVTGVRSLTCLIKPEIVGLKQLLKFGEESLIVEGINCLHITSAVLQATGHLWWQKKVYFMNCKPTSTVGREKCLHFYVSDREWLTKAMGALLVSNSIMITSSLDSWLDQSKNILSDCQWLT
jgi:hypothetical protein